MGQSQAFLPGTSDYERRCELGCVRRDRVRRQDGEHGIVGLRLTQGRPDTFLPKDAGRTGQRTQMLGTGVGRRKQHEDQVGRALIDGLEVGWFQQPGKPAYRPRQRLDPRMRNRDALANAGRTKTLTLLHGLVNLTRIKAQRPGHEARKLG